MRSIVDGGRGGKLRVLLLTCAVLSRLLSAWLGHNYELASHVQLFPNILAKVWNPSSYRIASLLRNWILCRIAFDFAASQDCTSSVGSTWLAFAWLENVFGASVNVLD